MEAEIEIRKIRFVESEKCIEVYTKQQRKYYLKPTYAYLYHIIKGIAKRQRDLGNEVVQVEEAMEIWNKYGNASENTELYRTNRSSTVKNAKVFYQNWAVKFQKANWWEIQNLHREKIKDNDIKKDIIKSLFRIDRSDERAVYWLGDISEVQIIIEDDKEWKQLVDSCRKVIESSVSRLTHKYDLEVYVHRKDAEKDFSNFLNSPKNFFLLIGKSGTGKTNTLCHLAMNSKNPCLLLSGDFYPGGKFHLEEEIKKHLLSLGAGRTDGSDFVSYVNELCIKNGKYLVIYIDALNEFPNFPLVLQELLALVTRWGAVYTGIKFFASCRTPALESLVSSGQAQLPYYNLYCPESCGGLAEYGGDRELLLSTTLKDFDEREFNTALKQYRKKASFTGDMLPETKEMCQNPFLLGLVSQIWAGKELPGHIDIPELWNVYWKMMIDNGPKGTASLLLDIVAKMRSNKKVEISEVLVAVLSSYSEKRFKHLVSAGVLNRREDKYNQTYIFNHERLLEYTLARSLLVEGATIFENIPALLQEKEEFPNMEGAVILLASMVDKGIQSQLLKELAALGEEGQKLACDIIEELGLTSIQAWNLLEQLIESVPYSVVSVLGEIGGIQPEKTEALLTELVKREKYWNWSQAHFFSSHLHRLCMRDKCFISLAEKYAKKGRRYKTISLLTLSYTEPYDGWVISENNLRRFLGSKDKVARESIAFAIYNLAKRNNDMALKFSEQLAKDSNLGVRQLLASSIAYLGLQYRGWRKLLLSFAKSRNWEKRQVAARAIGLRPPLIKEAELYDLAKKLSKDRHHKVREEFVAGVFQCPPYINLFEGVLAQRLVPLIESAANKASHKSVSRLFHSLLRFSIRTNLIRLWYNSENTLLREASAAMWGIDLEDMGIEIAYSLAGDTSRYVRRALALRFACVSREKNESVRVVFEITKNLLRDADSQVRFYSCAVIFWCAKRARKECLLLLQERATKDDNDKVRCQAIKFLVRLDEQETQETECIILECIKNLNCWGELTDLGLYLGQVSKSNELRMNFICKLSKENNENCQHVAAVSLWPSLLSQDIKRLPHHVSILSEMVKTHPSRSHIMLFAWLMMDVSEAEADDRFKSSLPELKKLLIAGFKSKNRFVRFWATWAAWSYLAFFPSILGDCATKIIKDAIGEHDWVIRLACAFHGGVLLNDKPNVARASFIDLVNELCDFLLHDRDELVRKAAAASLSRIPEDKVETTTNQYLKSHDFDYENIRKYSQVDAQNHFESLQACFYCRDFTWILEELAYEIDSMEEDRSKLFLAIWRLKPKETESLLENWRKHKSTGLQKTANKFFKLLKTEA